MKKNKKFHHAGRMVSLLLALCMILCMTPTALAGVTDPTPYDAGKLHIKLTGTTTPDTGTFTKTWTNSSPVAVNDDAYKAALNELVEQFKSEKGITGSEITPTLEGVDFTLNDTDNTYLYTIHADLPIITSVEATTGLTYPPVIGQSAGGTTQAKVPAGTNYTCEAFWWESGADKPDAPTTFESGHEYVMTLSFKSTDGSKFSNDCTATVDGKAATKTVLWNNDTEIAFILGPVEPVAESKVITSVKATINGYPPVVGEDPYKIDVTVGADESYCVFMYFWDDCAGYEVSDTFQSGHEYQLTLAFCANDGYTFADNCTANVNGEEVTSNDTNNEKAWAYFDLPKVKPVDPQKTTTLDLLIGGRTYSGIVGNQTIVVSDLDTLKDITVLKQNGVDIEGMSEDWSMSTKFLDSQGRGVLEVQAFEEGDDYVTFNLQSHYADCPGASVDDFQVMMITAVTLPDEGIKIIEGQNGKWTKGTKDVLTFKANGPFNFFKSVSVDGNIIDSKNYTAKRGSTIVALTPEYLETLSVGKHTFSINYGGHQLIDGVQAATEFEVIQNNSSTHPTGDSVYMVGDADCSGNITVKDATAIQKFVAGISLASFDELAADADQSGSINVKDATAVQKYLAGLLTDTMIGILSE